MNSTPQYWQLDKGRCRRGVVDRVMRDADIGVTVLRQHWVTAIGIASAPREIAAGDIDFDAAAGGEDVVDVAETDRHRVDPIRLQRLRLGRAVAIHRADNA